MRSEEEQRTCAWMANAEDARIKAYIWESIEETLKVVSQFGIDKAYKYAHDRATHLSHMSAHYAVEAKKLLEEADKKLEEI